MKIELTEPWSGYPPGHVFETMHMGMMLTLVQRKFAKVIEADKPKPKKAKAETPAPPVETRDDEETTPPETETDKRTDDLSGKRRGRKKAT